MNRTVWLAILGCLAATLLVCGGHAGGGVHGAADLALHHACGAPLVLVAGLVTLALPALCGTVPLPGVPHRRLRRLPSLFQPPEPAA